MNLTLDQFLAAFFPSPDEPLHLRAFKPKEAADTPRNKTLKIETTRNELHVDTELQHNLKGLNQYMGIYFVVNSGGDTDESITQYNAFFVEADELPIAEQHEKLDGCPIKPSIRVETKKSVHAYWLIEGDCEEMAWREMQVRLITYFNGDVKIKNPSRVMRLPFFNHLSGAVEFEKKRVTVHTFEPEARVTLERMQQVFPVAAETRKSKTNYSTGLYETWDALNSEARRRILAHHTVSFHGEWAKMKGICHDGKSNTGLVLNVASGAYKCQKDCTGEQVRQALGLPARPDGLRYAGATVEVNANGEPVQAPAEKRGKIIRARDLREKLFALYETGRIAGEYPGWESLAGLYTVARRQFTIVTGIPSHGKSSWLDNLLINLAQNSHWKFAICSLENLPVENHLSCLVEIALNKPFNRGHLERMSKTELDSAIDWVHERFYFVVPDENDCTIANLVELIDGLEVDGVVVDPMNEFEHRRPPTMTETEYVSQTLSKMRRKARDKNQHWWLVAHPTKLVKDKEGNYPVPTLYDVSGSAHYRNKADMGVVVWRDTLQENSPTQIYVQKVRFRWCGKLGMCELYYDTSTGRYFEAPPYPQFLNGAEATEYQQ